MIPQVSPPRVNFALPFPRPGQDNGGWGIEARASTTWGFERMDTRPAGVRVCGVLNIIAGIAGCIAGCGGWLATSFAIGWSGRSAGVRDVMAPLAALLAGVLVAISGVCLRSSSERARSVALGVLAVAVVLSLISSVLFLLDVSFEPFIGLTGLVMTLLGIVELFYLLRQRSAK